MTFDFTFCNFMFGLLLDDKTAAQAAQKVRALKETFAKNGLRFGDIFPLRDMSRKAHTQERGKTWQAGSVGVK